MKAREENGTENGALRNAPSKADGFAFGGVEVHQGTMIAMTAASPLTEAGRKAKTKKLVDETNMPNRVKLGFT